MNEISPPREQELRELEQKLGTSFTNRTLFNQALTHSSFGNEQKILDNERLEFLGDAILKLVISEYLYHKFPEKAEGDLTKIRAAVISDDCLAATGRRLDLGKYLLLSNNEKRTGGTKRKSNLANVLEAIMGAIFLDAGLGKSREMILNFLTEQIEKVSRQGYIVDHKSTLQELTQKNKWALPQYKVIRESGPKHRRVFWVEVKIRGKGQGVGRGRNKKEAEQRAAMQGLRKLKIEIKEQKEKSGSNLRGFISQVRKKMRMS